MEVIQAPVAVEKPGKQAKGVKGASKMATKPLQSSSGANIKAGLSENSSRQAKTIEETYQKKTQLEHILLRPDTYVGSIEKHNQFLWVYEDGKMVQQWCSYVPGLYKIFDEILVNAADNKQRDPSMDSLKVDIDVEKNTISVFNNGAGVPVEIHAEEQIYVPEMIFGHLLTSSNYDDSEKKTTGGRNGYGAKLANIFSTEFIIETADGTRQRRYKQVFRDNMGVKLEPTITKCKSSENWTKVTFQPDLAKFNMTELEKHVVSLMSKRVLDMAGCLGKSVKVELNGQRVPVKSFDDYIGMCISSATDPEEEIPLPKIYERVNARWEVCVSMSDGQFQQVSFVNSIATIKGGTHVQYVSEQITNHLLTVVGKKNKHAGVKAFQLRNHLWVFVNALIDNPAFDSQTKETLTTRPSSFGSKCELSPEFLKKVSKCGIVDKILSWADTKQNKELKKNDGSKQQRITGITKLDDANDAGGRYSQDCTLILTEGDSAKALAMSGISVVGRNRYGCFPLRGKLLNVREANHQQVMDNAEINNIKKILGLQHGKEYISTQTLRYGHLMIMTDQDHDGSHIKGLLINFIHSFWPSLLKIPSFLVEFITPIVKGTHKNGRVIAFYSMPEYETWKNSLENDSKNWTIKYYKGLGTSTAKEGKEYFRELVRHKKQFHWEDEKDGDAIEMAFSKKKVDARKTWLRNYEPGTFLDQSVEVIKYNDFVNKELIQFSIADLARSIPSMVDGLKPGQRKILFCAFKRNFVKQAKVAQFSGYVSEHSAYHHGEQSLASTIIGMAQTYVGSNNINLLAPLGQFGTRSQGGKDHASSRYIFTCLAPITRFMFPQSDDMLLDYQNDDGQPIEPTWYAPIIPLVLVNGSEGIGTGWSSFVPNYNPRDIIDNIRRLLKDETMQPMDPWYKGFKGTIEKSATKETGVTYTVTGSIEQIDETTLKVTELPVRKWTQDYKEFLETLMLGTAKVKEPFIKDYREHNTDTIVDFEIQLPEENLAIAIAEGLTKKFKLTTNISTSNMHLFDKKGIIKKYDNPEQILEEFFHIRLELYVERKAAQVKNLELELLKLANKVRFILGVVKGEIIVSNRKRADLLEELRVKRFTPFPKNGKKNEPPVAGAEIPEGDEPSEQDEKVVTGRADDYEYLLSMAIGTLTFERVEQLLNQQQKLDNDVTELRNASPKTLWERDLDALVAQLEAQEKQEAEDEAYEQKNRVKEGAQIRKKGAPRPKAPKKETKSKEEIPTKEPVNDSIVTNAVPKNAAGTKQPKGAAGPKQPKPRAGAKKKATAASKNLLEDVASDDDLELGSSLAERFASRTTQGNGSTEVAQTGVTANATGTSYMDLSSEDEGKAQQPLRAKVPRATKNKPQQKRKVIIDDSETEEEEEQHSSDDESDFEKEISPPKSKAAKKPAATKNAPANPKPAAAAATTKGPTKKRASKQTLVEKVKEMEGDLETVVKEIARLSPYKKSPEKKVRKIRISPFHKKSGPLKAGNNKMDDLPSKFPSLDLVDEAEENNSSSPAPSSGSATASDQSLSQSRPKRAVRNNAPVKYFAAADVVTLSDDSAPSDTEDSSEFDSDDE